MSFLDSTINISLLKKGLKGHKINDSDTLKSDFIYVS